MKNGIPIALWEEYERVRLDILSKLNKLGRDYVLVCNEHDWYANEMNKKRAGRSKDGEK